MIFPSEEAAAVKIFFKNSQLCYFSQILSVLKIKRLGERPCQVLVIFLNGRENCVSEENKQFSFFLLGKLVPSKTNTHSTCQRLLPSSNFCPLPPVKFDPVWLTPASEEVCQIRERWRTQSSIPNQPTPSQNTPLSQRLQSSSRDALGLVFLIMVHITQALPNV